MWQDSCEVLGLMVMTGCHIVRLRCLIMKECLTEFFKPVRQVIPGLTLRVYELFIIHLDMQNKSSWALNKPPKLMTLPCLFSCLLTSPPCAFFKVLGMCVL